MFVSQNEMKIMLCFMFCVLKVVMSNKPYLGPLTPSSSSISLIINSLQEKGSAPAVYRLFLPSYAGSLIPRSDSLYSLTSSAMMDLFTALEDTSGVIVTYLKKKKQRMVLKQRQQ